MYEAHELILKRHKFTGGVCWPLINLEKFTLLGRLLIARAKWVLSTVANRKQATMLSATLIRLVFTLFRIKKSLMNILLSSASGQVSSIVASTSVQTDYLNKKTPKLWNQSAQLMADTTARVVGERTFWNWFELHPCLRKWGSDRIDSAFLYFPFPLGKKETVKREVCLKCGTTFQVLRWKNDRYTILRCEAEKTNKRNLGHLARVIILNRKGM